MLLVHGTTRKFCPESDGCPGVQKVTEASVKKFELCQFGAPPGVWQTWPDGCEAAAATGAAAMGAGARTTAGGTAEGAPTGAGGDSAEAWAIGRISESIPETIRKESAARTARRTGRVIVS